jgi:hypothetical protein
VRCKCYRCGRFVGRDGFVDVTILDLEYGVYELGGYHLCAKCLEKIRRKNLAKRLIGTIDKALAGKEE